jgi:hypothetical protein
VKLGRNGPDTTLQAGDVIRFDQSAKAIVISRGGDEMYFNGDDNKFGFAGEMTKRCFLHVMMLLAETNGLNFGTIKHTDGASKDPYFIFEVK